MQRKCPLEATTNGWVVECAFSKRHTPRRFDFKATVNTYLVLAFGVRLYKHISLCGQKIYIICYLVANYRLNTRVKSNQLLDELFYCLK